MIDNRVPVWDQHACLPLQTDADVGELRRYRRPAGGLVSGNVGYAPHCRSDSIALLAAYRAAIDERPELTVAAGSGEVDAAIADGKVAVIFDLEDSAPLDGRLDAVADYVALGVRTLLPTYNHANAAGGGCLDAVDTGLTAWGRDLVREMNTVGMVVDGSHCGARTGLDMCAVSTRPVIYSHSCLRSVWEHPRNITDDQARACAATGGVVGITGVGSSSAPTPRPWRQ